MSTLGQVAYREGYKYQLDDHYFQPTKIRSDSPVDGHPYIRIDVDGILVISKGYAWDGPSGPTIDTATFMRGSLVHDALYQLIRGGWLGRERRLYADQLLRQICREDGMNPIRAWWVYRSVRIFGSGSTRPSAERPVKRAP